jgi:transposase
MLGLKMAKAYSNDLRERVIKKYLDGMSKEDIVNIFVIGLDTLNKWIRKYKKKEVLSLKSKQNFVKENLVMKNLLMLLELNHHQVSMILQKNFHSRIMWSVTD